MLKISRLSDYALVVLSFLAKTPQESQSASELAEQSGIALPTVSKVLKLLNEGGLITSSRGAQGGYRLIKNADLLTLAEVITAIEGSPALTECCLAETDCVYDSQCKLQSNWRHINQLIIDMLKQFTLEDLRQSRSARVEVSRGK